MTQNDISNRLALNLLEELNFITSEIVKLSDSISSLKEYESNPELQEISSYYLNSLIDNIIAIAKNLLVSKGDIIFGRNSKGLIERLYERKIIDEEVKNIMLEIISYKDRVIAPFFDVPLSQVYDFLKQKDKFIKVNDALKMAYR